MAWVVLIIFLGLLFDYTNGFHDVANVVSTIIATGVLRPLVAIGMAALLNTIGATQVGAVARTIAEGLVDQTGITEAIVVAALCGAIVWNLLSWVFALPSSSSYALIGGVIGAAWRGEGSGIVHWESLASKVIIPMAIAPLLGFLLALGLMRFLFFLQSKKKLEAKNPLYSRLQIGSAGLVALSHGMNDAQKSMGIITLGLFAAKALPSLSIPLWVIFACALTMGLGTAWGGLRIIRTVGTKITPMVPLQGFAAELSASSVILTATFLGMPLSSTQMIVGSIAGVGVARQKREVNWTIARKIALTWILTLPGSALISAFAYTLYLAFRK